MDGLSDSNFLIYYTIGLICDLFLLVLNDISSIIRLFIAKLLWKVVVFILAKVSANPFIMFPVVN